jgi:hypothetical protein
LALFKADSLAQLFAGIRCQLLALALGCPLAAAHCLASLRSASLFAETISTD